jgi:AcrR family transcriptional regulator
LVGRRCTLNAVAAKRDAVRPRREAEVLEAAAAIFHRRGYADTSVQDIADALGILKGSLYHYIDSKEDLLYRILREAHEDAYRILEEVRALEAPPLERLAFYIREHVAFNARNVTKIAVYYHDFALLTGERREDIVRRRAAYEREVATLIDAAKADGAIDASIPTSLATSNVLAQVIWVYTWYKPGGRLSPGALGRAIAEMAIGGLTSGALTSGDLKNGGGA